MLEKESVANCNSLKRKDKQQIFGKERTLILTQFDPSFDLEAVNWSRTYRSTLKALTNFKGVKQYEI